jgi:hypothetical protein
MTAPAEGFYTVNRDGDRVWVGSAASELAYQSARADILADENSRLKVYIAEIEGLLKEERMGRDL